MKEILRAVRNVLLGVLVLSLTFALAMTMTAYELREAYQAEISLMQQAIMENDASMKKLCERGDLFKFERDGIAYFCVDSRVLDDLDGLLEPQESITSKPQDGEYAL